MGGEIPGMVVISEWEVTTSADEAIRLYGNEAPTQFESRAAEAERQGDQQQARIWLLIAQRCRQMIDSTKH